MRRVLALALLGLAPAARADAPALILFGGGYGPASNQASIEAQIEALGAALAPASSILLFGGPRPGAPEVQIQEVTVDEAERWLALVFGAPAGIGVGYRPTRLAPRRPATRASLLAALAETRDRPTVVFGAGHGSPAPAPGDAVALELWDEPLTPPELARALDAAPRGGPLALVLGQCHSGGFTDLAYVDADPRRGLAAPARCAFAAVPRDRQASGCTADLGDPSARAFLGAFAAAIAGPGDLDADGAVTVGEAFRYAAIHDPTVNVPISSRGEHLRRALGPRRGRERTRAALLAGASAADRAVLTALWPGDLDPAQPDRAIAARLAELGAELERLAVAVEEAVDALDDEAAEIRAALLERWPELSHPYHPRTRALLAAPGAVVDAIVGHPARPAAEAAEAALRGREAELDLRQREEARLLRFRAALERVELEARLARAPARVRAEAGALAACEALVLRAAASPSTPR